MVHWSTGVDFSILTHGIQFYVPLQVTLYVPTPVSLSIIPSDSDNINCVFVCEVSSSSRKHHLLPSIPSPEV